MTTDDLSWISDWAVGIRVWVERDGRAMLGEGRLELLETIDRQHSISAAARHLGMSYRHAWLQVQSINEAAGEPLVAAATGGRSGGGAHLTRRGRLAVAIFRDIRDQMRQAADTLLPRLMPQPAVASVHVASAVSLEEVLGQLLAGYARRQPAVRVRVVFGASDELADHLLAGTLGDLFLTADDGQLDRLETAGIVESESRTVLAENRLAAVAPPGSTVRVRRPADLLRPDVSRVAVAGPDSPLGGYTRDYLDRLGLYDALLPRAIQVDNSRSVVAAVRAGQADVGLVYHSDAVGGSGCRLLFQVRRAPAPIRYTAAVVRRGRQPDLARALLRFLASRPAVSCFRRCGFLARREPGPSPRPGR